MKRSYLALLITGAPRVEVPQSFREPEVDRETGLIMLSDEVGIDHEGLYQFGAVVFVDGNGLHRQRFENGLRDAMRSGIHIKNHYDETVARVELAQQFAHEALTASWFADRDDDMRKEHFVNCNASAARLLEDRTQPLLAEAVEMLHYGDDMYDVLDRFNPFRGSTINVAVLKRCEGYINFADYQRELADARYAVMLKEMKRNRKIFHAISMELTEMSRWFRPGFIERIKDGQLESMLERLDDAMKLCKHVVVHPDRELAFNIETDMSLMSECMEEGKMDAAAIVLARALRSLMIPTVVAAMHEIITLVSVSERQKNSLSLVEWRLVHGSIHRLCGELERIDDSKFRRPVMQSMLTYLWKAIQAMGVTRDDTNLIAVKEHLLAAARVA